MTEAEEVAYMQGVAQRNREILGILIRELPEDERTTDGWRIERMDAISTLRSLCRDFGDNNWPDNLAISDIIEQHLVDYLRSNE